MGNSSDNFIAITGMSCRFAGAADLRGYWMSVLFARPSFGDIADNAAGRHLQEPPSSFRHLPTMRAALLGDLWRTDSSAKAPAAGVNPVMLLAADLVAAALKSATKSDAAAQGAATPGTPRERIAAFIGHSPALGPAEAVWCQHGFVIDQTMELVRRCIPYGSAADFESLRQSLDAALPQFDSRSVRFLLPQTLATFVAERCNLAGPALCIDAGDCSSAAAIQAGCDALLGGRADLAVAGAVQGPVSAQLMMPFAKMGLLSKSGSVQPFCKGADGTLPGEGGGFFAMKRYSDAIRNGDRIFAIIRATATATGGNSKRIDGGYSNVLRAVWPPHDPDPAAIDYLEGNGAGIPTLDRAELRSFSSIAGDAAKRNSIALGAAKALVGDCLAAAGMAGAIKAALALYLRIIPPALPQPLLAGALDLSDTPFYLPPRPRPWIHNDAGAPRRAAVASIGIGGTASLMVLEQTTR